MDARLVRCLLDGEGAKGGAERCDHRTALLDSWTWSGVDKYYPEGAHSDIVASKDEGGRSKEVGGGREDEGRGNEEEG